MHTCVCISVYVQTFTHLMKQYSATAVVIIEFEKYRENVISFSLFMASFLAEYESN